MRSYIYVLLLGAALLTLALVVRSGMFARKNPGEPINAAMRAALAETTPELSEEDATLIRRQYPTAYTSPSGLMYLSRAPGTGTATPKVGDTVVANYVGRLLDGTPFDSSIAHGGPVTFQVGVGQGDQGLGRGLPHDEEGRKEDADHPLLARIRRAQAARRPSRTSATVVFDVELVDFR